MRWLKNRLTHPWQDPLTGDIMGQSDHASWIAQSVIRRWTVFGFYLALSITWWIRPGFFGDDYSYTHWMILFSLLAVLQEQVVGIGMFGQTRRDAVVLRELRALMRDVKGLVERQERELSEIEETADDIEEALSHLQIERDAMEINHLGRK